MNAIALSISDIFIRQDDQNRYCLNDLHKASGGEDKHQPSNWLRLQQTIDFVSLLKSEQRESTSPQIIGLEQKQPLKVVNGGSNPGTFGVWELVYHYAMWISAEFNLKVIRAYHTQVTAQPRPNALRQLPLPEHTIEMELEDIPWKHKTRQLKMHTGSHKARMAERMAQWIEANHPQGVAVGQLVAEFFSPQDGIGVIRDVLNRVVNGGQWWVRTSFVRKGYIAAHITSEADLDRTVERRKLELLEQRGHTEPPAPKPNEISLNQSAVQQLLRGALAGQRLVVSFNPDGTYAVQPIPADAYLIERSQLTHQLENLAEAHGLALVSREAAKAIRVAALHLEGVR